MNQLTRQAETPAPRPPAPHDVRLDILWKAESIMRDFSRRGKPHFAAWTAALRKYYRRGLETDHVTYRYLMWCYDDETEGRRQ